MGTGSQRLSPPDPVTMPGRLFVAARHTIPKAASAIRKVWGLEVFLSGGGLGPCGAAMTCRAGRLLVGGCLVAHVAQGGPLLSEPPVTVQVWVRGDRQKPRISRGVYRLLRLQPEAWNRAGCLGQGQLHLSPVPGLWEPASPGTSRGAPPAELVHHVLDSPGSYAAGPPERAKARCRTAECVPRGASTSRSRAPGAAEGHLDTVPSTRRRLRV